MIKVFIDGRAGTTGIKIEQRLASRKDIALLTLPQDLRKDAASRKQYINESDVTFLCLPDDAARESVSFADGNVKIIDASTAHRTENGWAYGFPELGADFRDGIVKSNRVAVPGCHASGFLSLTYPLIKSGVLPKDYPLSCFSVTGFSGGGNEMIKSFETDDVLFKAPRQYALEQTHKHLKEMKHVAGLDFAPLFHPVVSNYYCGMEVTVSLYSHLLGGKPTARQIHEFFSDYYNGQKMVSVLPYSDKADALGKFLPSNIYAEKDFMKILVCGNDERITLVSLFDNLGKGASGAAVQCMNIMNGIDEATGLIGE